MEKTIEDLKKELAEEEALDEEGRPEESDTADEQEGDDVDTESSDEPEGEDAGDDDEGKPVDCNVEPWMMTGEEDEEDDPDDDKTVPLVSHIKQKKKLKSRISDQKDEIAELKAEIAALKTGSQHPAQQQPPAPGSQITRPRRSDFDDDEDFDAAYDVYLDKKEQERQQRLAAQSQQKATEDKFHADILSSVDGHESRSIELSEKHGIKLENVEAANRNFRLAVDSVFKGKGDDFADILISKLGEGSEKVVYHLGVNESARGQFIASLANDPNGLEAMVFLGQKKAELNKPNGKTNSRAPKPSAQHKGSGSAPKAEAKKLKQAHDKALKDDNLQEVFNIRRKARAAKIDVSEW